MAKEVVYAKSKYVRTSAQKARLVVDMVRGENALYSVEMLNFVRKAAALPVRKTIESAIANAEFNHDLDKSKLKIVEAMVNEAPTLKRGRAVSKGRYHQILKRSCHIIIGVAESKVENKAAKELAKIKEQDVSKKDTKGKKVKEDVKKEKTEKTEKVEKVIEQPKVMESKKPTRIAQIKGKGLFRRVQARGK